MLSAEHVEPASSRSPALETLSVFFGCHAMPRFLRPSAGRQHLNRHDCLSSPLLPVFVVMP